MESMTAHQFTIEQRQVPGTHQHGWIAVDDANGAVIDLPHGGTGDYLGRYPEIAAYLSGKGIDVALDYCRRRGDTFDADHQQRVYTWTFETGGGVVVRDIPRLVAGISVRF
jgi:hypothetical protein